MGSQPGVDYAALVGPMNDAMIAANCTTPDRAAMWCAQIGHESVGLRYMEEIASGQAYEWRQDLGNVYAGDGKRFKGRGPIQLTGRNNYRAFTRWANSQGHSAIDFEAEPRRVSEPKWGFLAATYYWTVSRPNLNKWADERNILNASREINGWVDTPNGMADRRARYSKALNMGSRLLPGKVDVTEKVLDYSRNQIAQDTFYNCGPASVQTIVQAATGKFFTESEIGAKLGTHTGGTDYIGSFPDVLNSYIGWGKYAYRNVPGYLGAAGKNTLWENLTNSIDAGLGVVVNIVAPPSNYPKAVYPSTISPAYSGGTVYHYIAAMGYRDDGTRKVWIADSGFSPYGYWLSFDQLCSLIVPKGYAYSTAITPKTVTDSGEFKLSNIAERRIELVTDQLAGPGKNDDGTPNFHGWDYKSVLAAAKSNLGKGLGLTLVQQIALVMDGQEQQQAQVAELIAAIKGEK